MVGRRCQTSFESMNRKRCAKFDFFMVMVRWKEDQLI